MCDTVSLFHNVTETGSHIKGIHLLINTHDWPATSASEAKSLGAIKKIIIIFLNYYYYYY